MSTTTCPSNFEQSVPLWLLNAEITSLAHDRSWKPSHRFPPELPKSASSTVSVAPIFHNKEGGNGGQTHPQHRPHSPQGKEITRQLPPSPHSQGPNQSSITSSISSGKHEFFRPWRISRRTFFFSPSLLLRTASFLSSHVSSAVCKAHSFYCCIPETSLPNHCMTP